LKAGFSVNAGGPKSRVVALGVLTQHFIQYVVLVVLVWWVSMHAPGLLTQTKKQDIACKTVPNPKKNGPGRDPGAPRRTQMGAKIKKKSFRGVPGGTLG